MNQGKNISLQGAYEAKFRSFVIRVSALQMLMEDEPQNHEDIEAAWTEVETARIEYNHARDAFARSMATGGREAARGHQFERITSASARPAATSPAFNPQSP